MINNFQHIDEQTLSRFVLNDSSLRDDEKKLIEHHLQLCGGCFSLYKEIREFYLSAEQELEQNTTLGERHKKEIVPSRSAVDVWTEPISAIIPRQEISLSAKIWYSTRKRPIASSVSFLALFAVMFFSFNTLPTLFHDKNPSHIIFEKQNVLVANKAGEIVWQKHAADDFDLSILFPSTSQLFAIVDLDGDGTNEIVTIIKFFDEGLHYRNGIYCFNSNGTIRWKKLLGREIELQGKKYPIDFRMQKMIASKSEKKFYVIITHSHSPSAIIALDFNGNITGELWNYGHIHNLVVLPNNNAVATMLTDHSSEPVIRKFSIDQLTGIFQMAPSGFTGISEFRAIQVELKVTNTDKFTPNRASFPRMTLLPDGNISAEYGGFNNRWEFSIIVNQDLYVEEILTTDTVLEKYGKQGAELEAQKLKKRIIRKEMNKPPV